MSPEVKELLYWIGMAAFAACWMFAEYRAHRSDCDAKHNADIVSELKKKERRV